MHFQSTPFPKLYTPYEVKDGLYFSAANRMREIRSKKKMWPKIPQGEKTK